MDNVCEVVEESSEESRSTVASRCTGLCLQCITTDKHYCCNAQCFKFLVSLALSITAVIISIIGLCGLFNEDVPNEFYTGLITFIVGLWFPTPAANIQTQENDL